MPEVRMVEVLMSEGQRLLTAPYEDRDTFIVNVMLVRGVIYLEEHYTDAQLLSKYVLLSAALRKD
jgi:hypothetical protein